MKKIITLGTVSLVASAFLVGCGSSSSDDNTADAVSTVYETGYFIDAPVANCEYTTTSGKSGKTDTHGKFQYKKGDKVKFSIGKLSLGEASPAEDGLITPKNLGADEAQTTTLLRVLQALDSDNDPSNGITISEDIIKSLQAMTKEVNLSKLQSDKAITDLNKDLADLLDEDFDGKIDVSHDDAQKHFDESLKQWGNGHKPDDNKGQGKGQGQENNKNGHGDGGKGKFNIDDYPKSELSTALQESLAYMGNEERLAYDIYTTLYNYHNENGEAINQLQNIPSRSEIKHVGIVQDLVKRYDINVSELSNVSNPVKDKDVAFEDMRTGEYDITAIQELYNALYTKGIKSKQDALEVGCMVEATDINDLDKYIAQAEEANATDVIAGFNVLRDGSYNHYWAFDKGLKKIGVDAGCGVLGEEYVKDYPQNKNGGHGEGTGIGQGLGQGHGKR
jgi:hypothetical protein